MADIEGGMFGDKDYFKPLVDSVNNMKVGNDWFLLANDFADYLRAQVGNTAACCGVSGGMSLDA
jgi:starch phosphorylase